MADAGTGRAADKASRQPEAAPFAVDELRRFIGNNAGAIRATGVAEFEPVAAALDGILIEVTDLAGDPEELEMRLTMLEQKLIALARSRQTDEQALAVRVQLNSQLGPYRSKMTAPQIAMLEAQFLDRALLEGAALPRLSLFYMA